MKVAALQLGSLAFSDNRLAEVLEECEREHVRILVLGEYMLNLFFKELEKMPLSMIVEQTQHHFEAIFNLSKKYDTRIVAPLVTYRGTHLYKSLIIANNGEMQIYHEQRLMPFVHWNEAQFFSNPLPKRVKIPPIFECNGFKVAVMFGYEAHFDEFWLLVKQNEVDLVLVPGCSTFGSQNRWRELLKTRAFLNSCYILRANRVGSSDVLDAPWIFYGDSFLVCPDGEIDSSLNDREGLLVCELCSKYLHEVRLEWAFR
ncbi:MAG: carbon-nitrogen hydrolase family protein [Wolinella sp.]